MVSINAMELPQEIISQQQFLQAVKKRDHTTAQGLLLLGVDPNFTFEQIGKDPFHSYSYTRHHYSTPLKIAIQNQDDTMVRLLLSHKANPNYGREHSDFIRWLFTIRPGLDNQEINTLRNLFVHNPLTDFNTAYDKNDFHKLPVINAICVSRPDLLPLVLLHPTININARSGSGLTPLMVLAGKNARQTTQILSYLLAKPELEINAVSNSGKTALDFAKSQPIQKLLIRHGAKNSTELESKKVELDEPSEPAYTKTIIQRPHFTLSAYRALGISPDATPYQILGISSDASRLEINDAFVKQSKKWLPENNPYKPEAKEVFSLLNWAYDQLVHQ